jgi:hypothetical protein
MIRTHLKFYQRILTKHTSTPWVGGRGGVWGRLFLNTGISPGSAQLRFSFFSGPPSPNLILLCTATSPPMVPYAKRYVRYVSLGSSLLAVPKGHVAPLSFN